MEYTKEIKEKVNKLLDEMKINSMDSLIEFAFMAVTYIIYSAGKGDKEGIFTNTTTLQLLVTCMYEKLKGEKLPEESIIRQYDDFKNKFNEIIKHILENNHQYRGYGKY